MNIDERYLDVRTVERNMKKGRLSVEDYQKHLDSLDDLSSKCDKISSKLESVREVRKVTASADADDDDMDDDSDEDS